MSTVKTEPVAVTVRILDKEYRVACPLEEQDSLLESARYLNNKMREVRDTGKVIGLDRISVMAGLNLAHELIQHKTQASHFNDATTPRLLVLQRKVERILDGHRNRAIDF
jgi:cell division protein ZapA